MIRENIIERKTGFITRMATTPWKRVATPWHCKCRKKGRAVGEGR
jgi:ribosomal protein L34